MAISVHGTGKMEAPLIARVQEDKLTCAAARSLARSLWR